MGGVQSSFFESSGTKHAQLNWSQAQLVPLVMPVWYLAEHSVTAEEMILANEGWNIILQDHSPIFIRMRETEGERFTHTTCVSFFYESFYARLFDVHPLCKPMFKSGLKSQGKFLMKMITLALSLLSDENNFTKTLDNLAESHNSRGIKALEYGIGT
jgi:hypothetical protein